MPWLFLYQEEDEEAGPLDLIKSQICDNVALYAQKYDEEFEVKFNSIWWIDFRQLINKGFWNYCLHLGESNATAISIWKEWNTIHCFWFLYSKFASQNYLCGKLVKYWKHFECGLNWMTTKTPKRDLRQGVYWS